MKSVSRMVQTRKAWAIDTRASDGHGFIGIGWFGWPQDKEEHLWGCRIALFETRRQARQAWRGKEAGSWYKAFPRARVVRVEVSVRTLPGCPE